MDDGRKSLSYIHSIVSQVGPRVCHVYSDDFEPTLMLWRRVVALTASGPSQGFLCWPAGAGSLWLFRGEGLGDQVCFYLFFSVSTVLSVAELSQKLARTQNMSSLLSPLSVCFTKCSINVIHTLPSGSAQTALNTSDSSERLLNFD